MKFKLDENLPAELAEDLIRLGHEADTVVDEGLGGAADPDVMLAARQEGRILLTLDKGIASLSRYRAEEIRDVVLFRVDTFGRGAVLQFIRERLADVLSLALENHLVVVGPSRIRIR